MQLFRYGSPGSERPAVRLPDGRRLDCASFPGDYGPDFFARHGLQRLATFVRSHEDTLSEVPEDVRYGPCLARPHKFFCIGLNYRDHARETGAAIPTEPVVFGKATSALCGPDDELVLPKGSTKTDWEVELLVVIGETARYVDEAKAMDHVAGYALHNDYSERHWQLERGGQWIKGKSFDTFAPVGPYFVPKELVRDVQDLPMWLSVNGWRRQESNTREMIFGVAKLVSYLSHCVTLEPGDFISTGTPAGVGLANQPPEYLQPGDVVELGIGDPKLFGTQKQHVIAYPEAK